MFTLPTELPPRARLSRGDAIHYSINKTIGNYGDWCISRVLLPKLVKVTNTIHLLAMKCQILMMTPLFRHHAMASPD
jgi:hypothetical protein